MGIELTTSFTDHVVKGFNHILPLIPNALFDLLLGILIIRVLEKVAKFVMNLLHLQPGLRDVLSSIIAILMWVYLTIAILGELGFNGVIYFFTGSVAAIGIAMAAGGSTLVSDVIAGIFLARDRDFNVGDEVIIGETPTLGVVEHMDARRIRLRDDKGILHIIPNSVVERKEWVVIRRRKDVSTLAKATKVARRIGAAAIEKRVASARQRKVVRRNEQ
jgi:small-conductance mechanosensitive channel